jgi:hypothetical protein
MVNTSFGCVNHPFAGGDSAMLLAGRMGANRLPVLGNDVIERSSSPTDDVIKCLGFHGARNRRTAAVSNCPRPSSRLTARDCQVAGPRQRR